jgi:hypothetical protein
MNQSSCIALVGDRDVFAGMQMMKRDRAGIAFGGRGLQRVAGAEKKKARHA